MKRILHAAIAALLGAAIVTPPVAAMIIGTDRIKTRAGRVLETDLDKLAAITASATELNYLDITAAGTVQASKAVIVDGNKDASAFRNLTCTNLDAGASGTAGSVDVFPSTASRGKTTFTATDNTGNTTTTINTAAQATTRTYTIPDAGGDVQFLMGGGAQTVTGVKSFTVPLVYDHDTGISAFAGGGQGSATALVGEFNDVTTCASNFDSVKLAAAVTGQAQTVKNSSANILAVFPATGDAINGLAVNLSIDIPAGGQVTFRAIDATTWETNEVLVSHAPTTQRGNLVFKAADSAGNTQTLVTNASQAGARTYTIPDAGGNADFVMNAGNQSIAGAKTFSGAITPTAGIAAAGSFSATPRCIHTGGQAADSGTDGTDTTPAGGAGTTITYMSEVFVPCNMTITGVAILNGSAVSGNVTVGLADHIGVPIAAAKSASTAQSGTNALQRVPFATPYAAVGPATYYVQVQADNNTARLRTHAVGSFNAQRKTNDTYGTFTTMTPAGTFTTAEGVMGQLY